MSNSKKNGTFGKYGSPTIIDLSFLYTATRAVQEVQVHVSTHLYDVFQVGAHARAAITICLQVVQESRDVLIIHTS